MTKKKTPAKKKPAAKKAVAKKTPAKKPAAKKAAPKKATSRRKTPKKKTTRTSAQQGAAPQGIIPKPIPASPPQQQVMPQVPASPFGGNIDYDEQKLDAYLKAYKDRDSITSGELNGIGVIMSRVGLLGAQLGKYTLHRKYANEAFAITIQK